MRINLKQFRQGTKKQHIEEIDFKKTPIQLGVSTLNESQFQYLITLVFNTSDRSISPVHLSNLVSQFKQTLVELITDHNQVPHSFKNDVLPSVCSGEFRKSDNRFHIHCLFTKFTSDPVFDEQFTQDLEELLKDDIDKFQHHRLNHVDPNNFIKWKTPEYSNLLDEFKTTKVNPFKLNEFETLISFQHSLTNFQPTVFNWNLDGFDGNNPGRRGRRLGLIDVDVKKCDQNKHHQPISDYILKEDTDLFTISSSLKQTIQKNQKWITDILTRKRSINPSVYLSNILKFIPDSLLEEDLNNRQPNFLFKLSTSRKEVV